MWCTFGSWSLLYLLVMLWISWIGENWLDCVVYDLSFVSLCKVKWESSRWSSKSISIYLSIHLWNEIYFIVLWWVHLGNGMFFLLKKEVLFSTVYVSTDLFKKWNLNTFGISWKGFGVALASVGANRELPYGLRQISLVLLLISKKIWLIFAVLILIFSFDCCLAGINICLLSGGSAEAVY